MNKQNITQAIQLAGLLQGDFNSYGQTVLYMKLLSLSHKLSKIDVQNCNGLLTADLYNDSLYKIEVKLKKILGDYKLKYYHQSDPRGVSLYIAKVNLTHDNYNMLGIAIY